LANWQQFPTGLYHKPYVRPIVRGKEVKPVEFGAKVNMLTEMVKTKFKAVV